MSKRKYKNAAEKQKAYRLRHGQKVKVPIEIRRGEKLGAQETDLRAKKEDETWEEYHEYIGKAIAKARQKQAKAATTQESTVTPSTMPESYYEIRKAHEKKLGERRRIGEKKK